MRQDAGKIIVEERNNNGPYQTVSEFARRTGLGRGVISRLSDADAFASLNQDRRAALWQALGQETRAADHPLLAGNNDNDDEIANLLPEMQPDESIAADYRTVGLSLRGHPIGLHRERLNELRVIAAEELARRPDGRQVRVAGLVIMRQRPSTAKGITFVTLEDETGVANLVVKPHVWERYRQVCRLSTAWLAHGKLENRSGVIHVVVNRIEDLSTQIAGAESVKSRDFR
jgi:error-prone DNA polymerase